MTLRELIRSPWQQTLLRPPRLCTSSLRLHQCRCSPWVPLLQIQVRVAGASVTCDHARRATRMLTHRLLLCFI